MKKLLLFLLVILIASGCVSQEGAIEKKVLAGTGAEFSKRDNVQGEEYYTKGEGVGLILSEKSLDDFAEEEYKETLKDINVDAIIVDCPKHEKPLQKDYCHRDRAVARLDESGCGKIETLSIKRQCIRGVAAARLDAAVCKRLDTEALVYNCISLIASDEDVLDESLCQQVPASSPWQEKCLERVKREKAEAVS